MLEATKRGCNSWKWYCRKAKCSAQPAKTVNHNLIDDNLPSSTISPRNAMRSSPLSECNSPIKSQSISLFLTISTKSNDFRLLFVILAKLEDNHGCQKLGYFNQEQQVPLLL